MNHPPIPRAFPAAIILILLLSSAAFSRDKDDDPYTRWGRSITVGPTEQAPDITCFGCSIHIRGQVSGDVTAFWGSITIEDQGKVAGDVTAFCGDIKMKNTAHIDGDAGVFGGRLYRDPGTEVNGQVTSMGSRAVVVLIALIPFVALGLLVAGVIWLIRRLLRPRRPTVPATAP